MSSRLPWGILLLFGGGFALAAGLKSTGLDAYLGKWLADRLANLSPLGRQGLIAGGMTFFTEFTSNTASVNMLLPILGRTARELGVNPLELMLPATFAASCAFMLPVATAPNAIVYGTGRIRMRDILRAGMALNLASIAAITAWMALLSRWVG
jgi:sodium-dependent dicarboxylate transporter 2/3/5